MYEFLATTLVGLIGVTVGILIGGAAVAAIRLVILRLSPITDASLREGRPLALFFLLWGVGLAVFFVLPGVLGLPWDLTPIHSVKAPGSHVSTSWMGLPMGPIGVVIGLCLSAGLFLAGVTRGHWIRVGRSTEASRPRTAHGRVEIAGVPIDRLDVEATLERLRRALALGEQMQVSTVNMDMLIRSQRQPELRAMLGRNELNVADGAAVVLLSRLRGRPVSARMLAAELGSLLMTEAAAQGAGVFLLGGEGGAVQVAAGQLAREHPGLRIAGLHEPPRSSLEKMDNDYLVELINRSGAVVLLVALGHPKQDLWIAYHRDRLPGVSVAVGCGIMFDVWAGRSTPAPAWMQRFGLEWLHSLLEEPSRAAGRYATAAWFVLFAFRSLSQRVRVTGEPGTTA